MTTVPETPDLRALSDRLAAEHAADEAEDTAATPDAALAAVRGAGSAERAAILTAAQTVGTARLAGASWSSIGAALGVSRQAAAQRCGRQTTSV